MKKRQDGVMTQTNGPRCPVSSFLRYVDKLNPECKWFWQKPKKTKPVSESDPWYDNVPVGKNTIGSKMKNISSRAGTNEYTNHCLRATSITTLQNAGFRDREIMSVSGHRSESSLKHYASTTTATKHDMSHAIATVIDPQIQAASPAVSAGPSSAGTSGLPSSSAVPAASSTTQASNSTKTESQEMRELNEILDEITNCPGMIPLPVNISSTSSHAHTTTRHEAPTYNFQNCVVHVHNYNN